MAEIRPVQTCRTNEGWIPILVPSSTQKIDYTVLVCPWGLSRENICECQGYMYTGHCRHQKIADDKLCRWQELYGPEKQEEAQRKMMTCPRCGGQTKWTMEVIDDLGTDTDSD
jgi:hypothetical protein